MTRLYVILTLLLLAGCAEVTQPPPPPAPPITAPEEAVVPAIPKPAPPPAPPKPVPKPVPKPEANPEELVGLDRDEVGRLLGDPDESRIEGGAHILTYKKHECRLELILFLDVKTGTDRVLSYDMPARRGHSCYTEFRSGR